MRSVATFSAGVFAVLLSGAVPARADDQPPADLPACPTAQDQPAVTPLLRRLERLLEGRSMIATTTMSIETPSWSRKLKMRVWTRGRDEALVRILEGGPREKGMATLKRGKQLWNYLPKAGRVMKLPSGMLGDSWMGSDFTNDDLVRGTSMVDDFDSRIVGVTRHADRDVWRVVMIPKPSAVIVWGKVEALVDRATCVPLEERFYDEDGPLARTMTFADLRTIGWRSFPTRVTIQPADSRRRTIVTYDEVSFDVELTDDTFSLHRLQQGR
jgi:hypothetical protein